MATEREINVKINLVPGQQGQLAAEGRRQAEELRRVQQELQTANSSFAPPPMASATTRQLRDLHRATAGMRPEGVGQNEWSGALAQVQRENEQTRQREILASARTAADGGPGLMGRILGSLGLGKAGPGGQGGQVGAGQVLGGVAQAVTGAQGGVLGLMGALGGMVPVLGATTVAAIALPKAVEALRQAFGRLQPTLAETLGELNRAMSDLNQGRQTGLSPAETLRRAFQGTGVVNELTAAENAGNPAQQQAILRRERDRAAADVARFNNARPEESQAEVSTLLTGSMRMYRAGGAARDRAVGGLQTNAFHTGPIAQRIRELWVQAGNRIEDLPEELRNIDPSTLTPERIAELSRSTTAGAVQARNRLQATNNALGPGGIPSLRPGAPDLSQLPSLFQSRQSDVLDIHAQIQQEAVRDQRQQAQFQAQMQLWQEILAAIQGQPAPPPPPVPAVA